MDDLDRIIDEMLAAQTRFAQAWKDGVPLTREQERDEMIRDRAKEKLRMLVTGSSNFKLK